MASDRFAWTAACAGVLGLCVAASNAEPLALEASAAEGVGVTPADGGPGSPVCEGDFNGDGVINFFDMVDFIDAYLNQDPAADIMVPYGVWNFLDIQMFIVRIRVGCPTP